MYDMYNPNKIIFKHDYDPADGPAVSILKRKYKIFAVFIVLTMIIIGQSMIEDFGLIWAFPIFVFIAGLSFVDTRMKILSMEFADNQVIIERTLNELELNYSDIQWVRLYKSGPSKSGGYFFIKPKWRRRQIANKIFFSNTSIGGRDESLEFIIKGFTDHGVEMRKDKRKFRIWA